MNPPVVLTIAGSDSGGGAGIQADLKTFAAMGAFGATAITAVTAQNTAHVRCVHVLPLDVVRAQIEAVLEDLPVAAVKTGMLATAETVELVAGLAEAGRLPNLVVDPVMVSSTGTRLLDRDAERLYRSRLLPLASAFTPNLLEAGLLVGRALRSRADQLAAAEELATETSGLVVVKGGHATDDDLSVTVDVCAGPGLDPSTETSRTRVDTANNHGSGCSFASALAVGLAVGRAPADAARRAGDFVHRAITGAAHWNLGSGHGPLDHFHWEAS